MTDVIQEIADSIIAEKTCGFSECTNEPAFKVEAVRIWTTDGGEVELAGYKNIPLNRVCHYHKHWKKTAMMIANKCWGIILRSLEMENPGSTVGIEKHMRLKRFVITWKEIG